MTPTMNRRRLYSNLSDKGGKIYRGSYRAVSRSVRRAKVVVREVAREMR